jgi:hypothetical protein
VRRLATLCVGVLGAALALGASDAGAVITDPTLAVPDLHIEGGSGWRPDNRFELAWTPVPAEEFLMLQWKNVPGYELPVIRFQPRNARQVVSIPAFAAGGVPPGAYQAEVWIEPELGLRRGPGTTVTFRFDDAVPPPPAPAVPGGWLNDRERIAAQIGHPGGAAPLSGIWGYAVSLTPAADEAPCADPRHCGEIEVDLPGGVGDDQLRLGPLLEGVEYLHVATVSGAGVASATRTVAVQIDAGPPAIRFAGVPAGWVGHPVQVSALAVDPFSGTAVAGPDGPFTALTIDGGTPTVTLGGAATATVAGEGVHRLSGWARDAVGNTGRPDPAGPAVMIDETPPRVAFAASQLPDDPELIRVAVSDSLSGASGERGQVAIRPAGGGPFAPLPTTVDGGRLSARWSSDDYPPGAYEFRATGLDAAGNPATTTSRGDGAPMVLHNPIKTPTRIASGFGGPRLVWQRCHRRDGGRRCHRETVTGYDERRPALRTVPYGRPLRFGGVLSDDSGQPLAHQPIEVIESFGAGADAAERRTTVLTGAGGTFGARLAPGPSRRVSARFAGNRTLTRAAGTEVSMAVRAGLRFHASTETAAIGGRPVVFSGRLLSAEASIPRTGRPIQLEFRLPGGTWSEFRTVQTDRHGRFRYSYSFTDDDSRGIRFQFRAVSPEQAGWPYRPAASAPVAVTGH